MPQQMMKNRYRDKSERRRARGEGLTKGHEVEKNEDLQRKYATKFAKIVRLSKQSSVKRL